MSQAYLSVNEWENNNKLQIRNRNSRARQSQTLTHKSQRPFPKELIFSSGIPFFRKPSLSKPISPGGWARYPFSGHPWQAPARLVSYLSTLTLHSNHLFTLSYTEPKPGDQSLPFIVKAVELCQTREETHQLWFIPWTLESTKNRFESWFHFFYIWFPQLSSTYIIGLS